MSVYIYEIIAARRIRQNRYLLDYRMYFNISENFKTRVWFLRIGCRSRLFCIWYGTPLVCVVVHQHPGGGQWLPEFLGGLSPYLPHIFSFVNPRVSPDLSEHPPATAVLQFINIPTLYQLQFYV